MSRLKTLYAVLLLALWVPATAHCALEAAGWLGEADSCCAEKKIDCSGDNCREIEGGVIKPANPSVQVSAPLLVTWIALTDFFLPATLDVVADFSAPESSRPLDWVNRWHFEHRAALPARAPSPTAA